MHQYVILPLIYVGINTSIQPVTSASSRKRPAEPSTDIPKRARISGRAQALSRVGNSVAKLGEAISLSLTAMTQPQSAPVAPPNTPRQSTRLAMRRAQQLEKEWLEPGQLLDFIEILEKSLPTVDTYMSIEDEAFRKLYVQKKLNIYTF